VLPTEVGLFVDGVEADRVFRRGLAVLQPWSKLERASEPGRWVLAESRHLAPEAYELSWTESGLRVTAGSGAGLSHALATFAQWLRIHSEANGSPIPHVRISDEPSFRHRGVLLDISRDKVPTLKTLFELIDRLAAWKINQCQLYTEHTFAYFGHEVVWQNASPLTVEDITTLDAYCADRFIELVPNQNSLGHFHRWLVHEPYRSLAECPEGLEHPFSSELEPFSLCPTDPAATALLAALYDQLLPHFRSSVVNVGMDESFDIGLGRSARAVEELGAGRVYLDFVHKVHQLAADRGHRIQLWGDIILQHPELVAELPEDAIVLNWGYEADHPFAEETERFAEADREFYVCPGTSSWNSLVGRASNTLDNLANASRSGLERGAAGMLITDWGDFGHWQPLSASYVGLFAGACFAWHGESAKEGARFDIASGLDLHLFGARRSDGGGLGARLRSLGDRYLTSGSRPKNGTVPFFQLFFPNTPLDHSRFKGASAKGLRETAELYADDRDRLAQDRSSEVESSKTATELSWAAELAALGAELSADRIENSIDTEQIAEQVKRRRRSTLESLLDRQPEIWRARHREGGRQDSLERLTPLALQLGRSSDA